jgi:dephospho-CoA kinase
MKIYGLTGGIASGKSAASDHFRTKGVPVIDSDALAHAIIEPDGVAFESVVEAFGETILNDGKIDRAKLGAIAFQSAEALETLNRLIHPAVHAESARLCAEYAAAGHPVTIIEAALHAEDGTIRDELDGLIVVDSPEDIRIERLMAARGLSHAEAIQRIRSQTPPEKKLPLASWIIHNNLGLDELHEQVEMIIKDF